MPKLIIIIAILLVVAFAPRASTPPAVRVSSKQFPESVILGEIAAGLISSGEQRAAHLRALGGTKLVYDALVIGDIDLYPEYAGTIRQEIFAGQEAATDEQITSLLAAQGIRMTGSLGFSNNYALAVRRDTAERLGLKTITDLTRHPELKLGLTNEFLDRGDGWKNLRTHYGLPHNEVTGMEHALAYRAIMAGSIDVTDAYTTDAELAELDLVLLEDDRKYFPSYEAVLLYRADLEQRFPNAVEKIKLMENSVEQGEMISLNAEVQSHAKSESRAAADYLQEEFDVGAEVDDEGLWAQVWHTTLEHLDLVRRSLIPAILVAVPLGVLAAKRPRLGRFVLGAAGTVQTIPALALLVLLIPLVAWLKLDTVGAGAATAVIALFLYSLLPVVQNTATGLASIPAEYHESAEVLALSPAFRLLHIELPLASPAILAGIKTAAVLNVGFATLGALVGARGYGQPILTGIRLNDTSLILQGAVPAACLAIVLQLAFELVERRFLPAGLRPVNTRASS